jgi:UDP-2,3-diacylglucosamine hydrolase
MTRDLIFVGDVHLDEADPHLDAFLAFLDRISETSSRIVLLGDLFNLWIGRRDLERPHQTAVLERLAALRRRGIVVRYLEGNRDYRIGPCYAGTCLDDATPAAIVETHGGRRLVAIHGDLANPADLRYRTWRRLSRTAAAWGLLHLLPRSRRLRFAESVERRLRSTNPGFKREFPERVVRRYAASLLSGGADAAVLGHFHVERDLDLEGGGRALVLPEWRESRRHLRVDAGGTIAFVDSPV